MLLQAPECTSLLKDQDQNDVDHKLKLKSDRHGTMVLLLYDSHSDPAPKTLAPN